jgi:hypothetical protein
MVFTAICQQPDILPRCQETAEWLQSRKHGCPPSASSRLLTVRRALRMGDRWGNFSPILSSTPRNTPTASNN